MSNALSPCRAAVLAALSAFSLMQAAAAAENAADQTAQPSASESGSEEEIVVRDTLDENFTSYQSYSRKDIDRMAVADGNITDLLHSNPAVQFSNASSNSLTMGEIRPADISIHGSVAYQNTFLLDGTSINSDMDPASGQDNVTSRLSGSDEQGFYIDARLLEGVTVYDSNIPVEFSGFTGGVVDAQTRSWTGENHINVFVRGSYGAWGSMIQDPVLKREGFRNDASAPAQYQEDFKKRTYGFSGEWGITDNLGVVVGYSRRESEIPIEDFPGGAIDLGFDEWGDPIASVTPVDGGTRNQKRISDNFFTKATLYANDRTTADLAFNYSASQGRMFLPGVSGSDYRDHHDGYNLTANLKHRFDSALWTSTLAYSYMVDERDSDSEMLITLNGMDENFNQYSYSSGGYGTLEQHQNIATAKTKLEFDPIQTGERTFHQFAVGADLSVTHSVYLRDEDYNQYQISDSMGYVFTTTSRQLKGKYTADLSQIGVFGEHLLRIDRVSLRSGLRFDYDDFTQDVNVAPRFTANWDVFGNGSTVFTAGANRYYGRNLLAYVLAEGQNSGFVNAYEYVAPGEEPAGGWEAQNGYAGLDDLKAPHSDEFTAGVTQRLGNIVGSLSYVHRNVRDEIRGHQEDNLRTFRNDGRTDHDAVMFSLSNVSPWKFAQAEHYVRLTASWQETKSNIPLHMGYTENNGNSRLDSSKVIHNGQLIDADDLDATDFNIPVKLALETTSEWPSLKLTWYNLFRWNKSRDQAIYKGDEAMPDDPYGPQYARYDDHHFDAAWTWDSKLQWKPDWARGVGISLEAYNLTNQKNVADVAEFTNAAYRTIEYNIYEPGRQFWLQLSYDY